MHEARKYNFFQKNLKFNYFFVCLLSVGKLGMVESRKIEIIYFSRKFQKYIFFVKKWLHKNTFFTSAHCYTGTGYLGQIQIDRKVYLGRNQFRLKYTVTESVKFVGILVLKTPYLVPLWHHDFVLRKSLSA